MNHWLIVFLKNSQKSSLKLQYNLVNLDSKHYLFKENQNFMTTYHSIEWFYYQPFQLKPYQHFSSSNK